MILLKAKYKYEYNMSEDELENYASMEDDRVIAKLKEKLQPCVGVDAELERLATEGKYHLSVVSSSALRRVLASIDKVGQDKYFKRNEVFSAACSLPKPTSKPDPAIYLHAIEVMGKTADECIAVEDSRSGATAAHRANIQTIGYTGCYRPEEQEKMQRLLLDAGCVITMNDWKDFQTCLEKIQRGEVQKPVKCC
jgi:HAD superfamily hydrolase (TIGR01509 family)